MISRLIHTTTTTLNETNKFPD